MSYRIKPYISLWDKSFNAANTKTYYLTMQLSLHGFYFAVFDPGKNKYLGLEAYRFENVDGIEDVVGNLDIIFSDTEWLAYAFSKVKLLYYNLNSTLVPYPLFSKEEKELFLNFNQTALEHHRVEMDFLKNSESVNVYYLPAKVFEKIYSLWPNAEINHLSSFLIECLMLNYKNKLDKSTLFIHMGQSSFDLINLANNKLLYFNSFLFNTKEDFLYFLLAAMEQLGFNPENANLVLMGDIDKSNDLYQLLIRYVGNCSFVEKNSGFKQSYVLDDIRSHQFYTLFNVLQCE